MATPTSEVPVRDQWLAGQRARTGTESLQSPPRAPPPPTEYADAWSLVSRDGRASMRLPCAIVVGSGACCGLRLSDDGVAHHHAVLIVDAGLSVVPLSAAPTFVDGRLVQGRQPVPSGAQLKFATVRFVARSNNVEPNAVDAARHQDDDITPIATMRAGFADDVEPRAEPRAPEFPPLRAVDLAVQKRRRRRRGWVGGVAVATAAAVVLWWLSTSPWSTLDRSFTPAMAVTPAPTGAAQLPVDGDAPADRPAAPAAPTGAADRSSTATPEAAPLPAAVPPNASQTSIERADALSAKGSWLTPARNNAAALYVDALTAAPSDAATRAKLDAIVMRTAQAASDMIVHLKFERARGVMAQLSAAIPPSARHFVSQQASDRWRVVELLLRADAKMQTYSITEPRGDNAVSLLQEVQRVDPHNPIADDMLAKAYGLKKMSEQSASDLSR